jgi:hypothetical protein
MMSSLDGGLANFAFAAQVAPSRRSPRKRPLPKPDDDEDELHEGSSSHSPPSKRKKRGGQLSLAEDHRHLSRSPTKLKRVYAAPETYAHLNVLQDHLRMHLDSTFIDRASPFLSLFIFELSCTSYVLRNQVGQKDRCPCFSI